ncbi:MAG: hypothetical protein ACAH80_14350 [Alphaproteobacteria bacterium]
MTDMKVTLRKLKKDVIVSVPDGGDMTEAFNEASRFVRTLDHNDKIRDREAGVNPPGATHEIVKDVKGEYRLQRFRFS